MNTSMKWSALGLLVAAGIPAAHAGSADSAGGIKVKSDDGRFESTLGGRLQYDYATFEKDKTQTGFSEGPYFRRVYITLGGKIFGEWKYKLEYDFASLGKTTTVTTTVPGCAAAPCNASTQTSTTTSSSGAAKEVWLGTEIPGGFIKAGHMQPAYGMEEMTSSNDVLFTERPYLSNNAVFKSREFQNSISFDTHALPGLFGMVAVYHANPSADSDDSSVTSTANGHGYSARVAYAPVMTDFAVVHLGVAYDTVAYKTGTTAQGANAPAISAFEVARNSPSLTLISSGAYDEQTTPIGEFAGKVGPFFWQGEYTKSKFGFIAPGAKDQSVTAYYAQASVFLTGESKPYKADKGVFGNPKPTSLEWGAIELKARYDQIENKDRIDTSTAAVATPTTPAKSQTVSGHPKLSMVSVGLNYYVNSAVRFMLDYNTGKATADNTGTAPTTYSDKPKAVVLRGQIAF